MFYDYRPITRRRQNQYNSCATTGPQNATLGSSTAPAAMSPQSTLPAQFVPDQFAASPYLYPIPYPYLVPTPYPYPYPYPYKYHHHHSCHSCHHWWW